jgi:hypothetical protein
LNMPKLEKVHLRPTNHHGINGSKGLYKIR